MEESKNKKDVGKIGKKSDGEKLTDKQRVFCEEYIVDLNATQAAIRAGYSENTARTIAAQNLAKLNIQEYIAELKKSRSERTEIDADRVLKEYAAIAFVNIHDFFNEEGKVKPINEINPEKARALKDVIDTKITTKQGDVIEKQGYSFQDKMKALEAIAKHIGFFETDNNQKKLFPDGFNINIKK